MTHHRLKIGRDRNLEAHFACDLGDALLVLIPEIRVNEGNGDGTDTFVPKCLELGLDLVLIRAGENANDLACGCILDDIGGLGNGDRGADERLQRSNALADLRVSSPGPT